MFIEEIANLLVNQGVGIVNASILLGSRAQIPVGDGPFLTLKETGGTGAARMHNSSTERPTAQVFVRAKTPSYARAMIHAAYDAFGGPDGLHNIELDGVTYLTIIPRQQPTDTGADEAGRVTYSFNIDAEKQRS